MYHGKELTCIVNDSIKSFLNDGIHLTHYPTSHLAHNLKTVVQQALNITSTPHKYPYAHQYYNRYSIHAKKIGSYYGYY